MQLLTPTNWQDYELIDCGDFEKLERFGKYVVDIIIGLLLEGLIL